MNGSTTRVGASRLGRGVFAKRQLDVGQVILRIKGPLITLTETLAKGPKSFYPVQVAPDLYVDVVSPACFLNHSCKPNAGFRHSIFLVAIHPIGRDEEIVFDYSTTMSGDPEVMACMCAQPTCRGCIGNFEDLPSSIGLHYLALDIVQPFISVRHRQKIDAE